MIKIYKQYKQQVNYLIFGMLTTLINVAMYYACFNIINFSNIISNIIAWILSVLFAYLTNKIWVFSSLKSDTKNIMVEMFSFFSSRLLTGLLDLLIMYICVDILFFSGFIMKLLSNIIVIVLNYVLSKFYVFKGNEVDKIETIK